MDQSLGLILRGQEFIFDCRRAIYWPQQKILLSADLHWGKSQYLRNYGIAVSDDVFAADLIRLSNLLEDYDVRTMLVLGDLIHHEKALTPHVVQRVEDFRHQYPCELLLIKGNHDRYTIFPESWGIVEEPEFYFQDFLFSHEFHPKEKKVFQFSGHLHPMLRLRAGHDEIRLPSFIINERSCLLPAFSHLTGGQDVKLQKGEKGVVVMDDGLEIFTK